MDWGEFEARLERMLRERGWSGSLLREMVKLAVNWARSMMDMIDLDEVPDSAADSMLFRAVFLAERWALEVTR